MKLTANEGGEALPNPDVGCAELMSRGPSNKICMLLQSSANVISDRADYWNDETDEKHGPKGLDNLQRAQGLLSRDDRKSIP